MPFDGILIHALIGELRQELLHKKVEKISQPSRDAVRIGFRGASLFLSVDASMSYYTLTTATFENPSEPPMFTMLLRKHLAGAVLTGIEQAGLDRVTRFTFQGYDTLGDATEKHIVIETMGRHSNLFLLDAEDRILDSIKRVSLDESGARLLLPGTTYSPLQTGKRDIRSDIGSAVPESTHEIMQRWEGFSPVSARYLLTLLDSMPLERAAGILFTPNKPGIHIDAHRVSKDFYHCSDVFSGADDTDGRVDVLGSIAETVDRFFARSIKERKMHQSLQGLKKQISTRIERLNAKQTKLRQELEETEQADEFRRRGQLLISNLYRIAPGSSRVTVEDYESGTPLSIEIALDTKLSPADNAQRMFRRYRKLQSGAENIARQLQIAAQDIAYLESTLTILDNTEDGAGSEEIRRELIDAGLVRDREKTKGRKPPKSKPLSYHRFRASDGTEILVGKSNAGNDHLSLKLADRGDIWLHTKDIPSAHVLLRTAGKTLHPDALLEAAMICALYSRAKHATKIAVDYCLAKFVKKPPGARTGMVTYSEHKTILVTPDLARVEALRS